MKNYDPNNGFGTHLVQLTFQQWEYKLTVEVPIGGNCKGLSIIDSAVGSFDHKLYREQGEFPCITLKNAEGEELETDIEDEEDLKNMLVEAKILSFKSE